MTVPITTEARIASLSLWDGTPTLEPLPGGLSNVSYLASDRRNRYVVRLTRDFPFHGVVRTREVRAARAAHDAGFAPELVHAEDGLTVTRFVEGRVLAPTDLQAQIPRIADLIRRFHTEMPSRLGDIGFTFDVFAVNRDYVRQLSDHAECPRWLEINAALEAAQLAGARIIGHHDLLAANLIDDGRRLWLIDYEYAGFGTPAFDLANLSSNNGFTADQSAELLAAYFGEPPNDAAHRAHAAMEAASLLREALWSLVSARHLSAPGADYLGYAKLNFSRFEAALAAWHERVG